MLRVLTRPPPSVACSVAVYRCRLIWRRSLRTISRQYLDHQALPPHTPNDFSKSPDDKAFKAIILPKDFSRLEYSIIINHQRSSIHRLLEDDSSLDEYLHFIASARQLSVKGSQVVGDNFIDLLQLVSGFPTQKSFALLLRLWQIILFDRATACPNIEALQLMILSHKERILYIVLNTRNYHYYELHVLPIYSTPAFTHISRSWNDRVVSTVQLQSLASGKNAASVISINDSLIRSFLLDSGEPIAARRKLVVQLVVAGCINSSNSNDRYFFLETFLSLMQSLGDDHLLFLDAQYEVYNKALVLMCPPTGVHFVDHMERITSILTRLNYHDPKCILNLISSIMSAIHRFSPNNVLNLWKYKTNLVASGDLKLGLGLRPHDLTRAMGALCKLRLFHECLALYARNPDLQSDEQIDVILRVCEDSKDWKMLQSQFEDMYGKGQLPFVGHYAIVMNALASIGARDEVDLLYAQFKKRKLVANAAIYLALIRSRLYVNDIVGAQDCFKKYLVRLGAGTISGDVTAYLHSQLFKAYFQMNDVDGVMSFLKTIIGQQKQNERKLLNSTTLGNMANFFAANLRLAELEFIRKTAVDLNLHDAPFLVALAGAYIRLDQFERAQEIIMTAHAESPVPYTNPAVYAQHLRLCRSWHAHATSSNQRHHLRKQMKFISKLVTLKHLHVLTLKSNPALLEEIIKYTLKYGLMDQAYDAFGIARNSEVLSEIHFLPFLKHYLQLNTPNSSSQVLKLYRRMAEERIEVTPRTYLYLMEALISLDCKARNGLENSYKLLQSIFDTNGLSLRGTKVKSKLATVALHEVFPVIGKIVASFVDASDDSGKTIDIFVTFIQQAKSIMGPRLSNPIRFMIYESMSRLYLCQNQYSLAEKIAKTGLADLDAIIDRFVATYPYQNEPMGQLPRAIEALYRKLAGTRIRCLRESQEQHEYVGLLKELHRRGIRFSGMQYNSMFSYLLTLSSPEIDWSESLPLILSISEAYLVAGNWVEASLNSKRLRLYKLAILHLCQGDVSLFDQYKILNDYYGVHSLQQLHEEFVGIRGRHHHLEEFISLFYRDRHLFNVGRMTHDFVLDNMPIFFVPERRIATPNVIQPYILTNLLYKVLQCCGDDKDALFKLMDAYPGTIEMLFYNGEARLRQHQFRREISQRVAPRSDHESSSQVKARAWKAMSELIRTPNATDFIGA